jgi:hypothetical protein
MNGTRRFSWQRFTYDADRDLVHHGEAATMRTPELLAAGQRNRSRIWSGRAKYGQMRSRARSALAGCVAPRDPK